MGAVLPGKQQLFSILFVDLLGKPKQYHYYIINGLYVINKDK